MNIIPIINYKINKDRWLISKPKYSDLTNYDILYTTYELIIQWIHNNDNLSLTTEYTLTNDFIDFIYDYYMYPTIKEPFINNSNEYDTFELYNFESILKLYNEIKGFTKSQNSDLFHHYKDDNNLLIEYIFSITSDNYNIDNEYEEIEDNENIHY